MLLNDCVNYLVNWCYFYCGLLQNILLLFLFFYRIHLVQKLSLDKSISLWKFELFGDEIFILGEISLYFVLLHHIFASSDLSELVWIQTISRLIDCNPLMHDEFWGFCYFSVRFKHLIIQREHYHLTEREHPKFSVADHFEVETSRVNFFAMKIFFIIFSVFKIF